MQTPSPLAGSAFNPAGWQTLGDQTVSSSPSSPLGNVPSNPAQWQAFAKNQANLRPYLDNLANSLGTIQTFVQHHAIGGPARQTALQNLAHFARQIDKGDPRTLTPLMLNENRKNLQLFADQLNNPKLSTEQKLGAALQMAQGLGVCKEGEALNILDATQTLSCAQSGFEGTLLQAKNKLLEQHLLAVVKHEAHLRGQSNSRLGEELEIHRVQALKNHVADQWGLPVIQDRYATLGFQNEVGPIAQAVLAQTLTPAALAGTLQTQIHELLNSLADGNLHEGMPAADLMTEPLRRALQATFGEAIGLEDCLLLSEDYSTIKLAPAQEVQNKLLQAMHKTGVLKAPAHAVHLSGSTSIEQAIHMAQQHRGPKEFTPTSTGSALLWVNLSTSLAPQEKKKKEAHNALHLLPLTPIIKRTV
ncbi:hypothetical protein [Limnobacter sp.]|uniref:hypothetical protein n=1 Tax=Limnobacter sp. TaxID=2003368 RepID=UPI003514AF59